MSEDDQICSICNCSGDEIEYLINCRECQSEKMMMLCKICCRKHLQDCPDHSQGMAIFCQECEKVEIEATFYCGSCGQSLCAQCDQRIHNKCKRAKHSRQQLNLQRDLLIEIIVIIDEPLANVINSKKAVYDGFIEKLQKKRIKNDKSSLVVVFRNTCEEILNFDLHYQWEQFERVNGQSERFLNSLKFMPKLTACIFFQTSSESYTIESASLTQSFPNIQTIFTKLSIVSPPSSAEKQILIQSNQQQIQHMHQVQQQIQHMFPLTQMSIKQAQSPPPTLQQSKQQISSQQAIQQSWNSSNQSQSNQDQQQFLQIQQQSTQNTISISQQTPAFMSNGSLNQQQQVNQQIQFCQTIEKNNNFNYNSNGNIQNQNKENAEELNNSFNSLTNQAAEDEQEKKGDSKSANGSQISKKKYGNKSLNALFNPSNSLNINKKNSQFPNKNQSFDDGFQVFSSSESHSNEGNPPSNLNSKFLLINNSNMNNSQNNSNLSNNNLINSKGGIGNQNSIYNQKPHYSQSNSIQQINQQNPVGDNSGACNNSQLRNKSCNSNFNIQSGQNNNSSPNSQGVGKIVQSRARNSSSNHKHSIQTNSNNITNPQLDYGNINSSNNNTNNSMNQFYQNSSNNNNNILTNQLTQTSNQINSKTIENTSRSSIHNTTQKQQNNSGNNNNSNNNNSNINNKNVLGSTNVKQKKSKKSSRGSRGSRGSNNTSCNRLSRNTSCNRLSRNTSSGSIKNLNTSKGSIDGGTNNILNNSLNQGLNKNSSQGTLETKSKNNHNTYTCGMPFQQFQNPKTVPVKNQQIAIGIQKQLSFLAEKGELMIHKEVFLKMIQNNIPGCTEKDCLEIFVEAEQAGIIHQTTRTFANFAELHFISLNLIWIIKSIKLDLMTPTDKLILSRIKECFGLKLTPKSWDMILNHLQHPSYIQNYQNGQNMQDLPQLIIQKVNDPLMGADTTVIYMKGQEWIPEDKGRVDFEHDKSWKLFKDFLESYFKQPINNEVTDDSKSNSSASSKKNSYFTTKITKSNKKQSAAVQQGATTNQTTSQSSSLNPNTNNNNNTSITNNQSSQQELRAIPGGRYGCVQYVKYCGPQQLQELSLGRLSLFVQEAINTGIIRYHRTLLVKHTYNEENSVLNESSSVFSLENSVHILEKSAYGLQRDVTVKHLQDAMLEILQEYPKGVSLVQIPQYLKKKVYFQFNLQDLGFPKLKNFIQTMPDKVQIELAGTNNSYAILKNNGLKGNKSVTSFLPESATSDIQSCTSSPVSTNNPGYIGQQINNINQQQQQNQGQHMRQTFGFNYEIPSSQQTYLNQHQQQTSQDFQNAFIQSQNVGNSEHNQKQAAIVLEKLNELLEKVKQNIEAILKQNPNGMHIKDLYSALSKSMGVNFQFGLFGSMDFLGFLTSYAESIIDIECKQNYYVIYQKNHRFGMEGKINGGSGSNNNNNSSLNKVNYNNIFQTQMMQMNNLAGNISQFQQPQLHQDFHHNSNLANLQGNFMNLTAQQNMLNFLQQNKLSGTNNLSQQSGQQQSQNAPRLSNSKKRSMAISQSASNILNNASTQNNSSTNSFVPPQQFNNIPLNIVGPQQSAQQHFFMAQQQQQFMQNPNIVQQQYLQSQLAQQYQMFGQQYPYINNSGVISGNHQSNQSNDSPQHMRSLSQHSKNKVISNNNLITGSGGRQNNTNMNTQINSSYNHNNQYHYHPHHPHYIQNSAQTSGQNNAYFTPFYQVDLSQFNSTHSRNPSKNRQRGEQSSMDIKENIGLIEDILQDTDENCSFRTQTDKTFMGDDNLTSFNWSISILNPHYQSDRQREISAEFEQFPCDLSKITNKGGGGSGSGGYQNQISSVMNDRITSSNWVNPIQSHQQQGMPSFQNVLNSTPSSQQQHFFVNPSFYTSPSYQGQNSLQYNANNSFTKDTNNNSERKM